MLPSYVLSLREGLEAALIIGIVLGALRKMRQEKLTPAVWLGALSAGAFSFIVALVLNLLGEDLSGSAEPVFEGFTMLLAAFVLTWMIFWMQRQSRHIKGELETGVRQALMGDGYRGLFFLAFVSVVREGIELALFVTAASLASDSRQTLAGSLLGLGTAALLGWSLFASIVRLDLGRFFKVTGFLLILFAAGLISHAAHEFIEIGWLPPLISHVWNLSTILSDQSIPGQVLSALFGYNASPSLMEVLAYLGYFAVILASQRLFRPVRAANHEIPAPPQGTS